MRRRKKASKDLLRAGERLRSAQEKALGGGGRSALEKAVAAERKAVEGLVAEARKIGEESGVKVSDANLARVQSTLHAVSLDPEVRERFEAGDLVEDHEATGVDALALMAAPAAKRAAAREGEEGRCRGGPEAGSRGRGRGSAHRGGARGGKAGAQRREGARQAAGGASCPRAEGRERSLMAR